MPSRRRTLLKVIILGDSGYLPDTIDVHPRLVVQNAPYPEREFWNSKCHGFSPPLSRLFPHRLSSHPIKGLVSHIPRSPSRRLPKTTRPSAREKGCWSIDASVSGGDIGAREGKVAIFAGGERPVVEWLKPLFDLMGRMTYMGEAGCGQSWLDLRKYMGAIRGGSAVSMAMELFGGRTMDRDFKPGGFVEYMVKDLGLGGCCEGR
ncbi:RmlC-like cupins superfamily protein [Hibiscus syriacus]|uniref:RmlC-like cupins superfamily protein n=1 Tax=Hibiscus syriacus TaxID=106335 RepID=A0A6A2Y876_HIBSY|nr:RmlC-like cupins superfamily protein [Hibiscus syriacus]